MLCNTIDQDFEVHQRPSNINFPVAVDFSSRGENIYVSDIMNVNDVQNLKFSLIHGITYFFFFYPI